MNNEMNFDVMNNAEGTMEIVDLAETTSKADSKLALGLLGAIATVGASLVIAHAVRKHKGKPKVSKEEKMIRKLEAKGYTVVAPLADIDVEIETDKSSN